MVFRRRFLRARACVLCVLVSVPARPLAFAQPIDPLPFQWPAALAGLAQSHHKLANGRASVTSIDIHSPGSAFNGISIVWLVIKKGGILRIQLLGQSRPLVEQYEANREATDIVLLSSGYFNWGTPSDTCVSDGLIVAGGKEISPQVPWVTGGVLFQRHSAVHILPIGEYRSNLAADWAVQAKVLLVRSHKVDKIAPAGLKWDRVAVGTTSEGSIAIIGAFSPGLDALALADFAQLLVFLPNLGGPTIDSAVNMDGGPSAHIYIPELGKHFGNLNTQCAASILAVAI